MKFCTNCGSPREADARFCSKCGGAFLGEVDLVFGADEDLAQQTTEAIIRNSDLKLMQQCAKKALEQGDMAKAEFWYSEWVTSNLPLGDPALAVTHDPADLAAGVLEYARNVLLPQRRYGECEVLCVWATDPSFAAEPWAIEIKELLGAIDRLRIEHAIPKFTDPTGWESIDSSLDLDPTWQPDFIFRRTIAWLETSAKTVSPEGPIPLGTPLDRFHLPHVLDFIAGATENLRGANVNPDPVIQGLREWIIHQRLQAIRTDEGFPSALRAASERCALLPLTQRIDSLTKCMTAYDLTGNLSQCQMRAEAALALIRETPDLAQRVAIAIAAGRLEWPTWQGGEPGFWLEAIHIDMDLAEAGRQARMPLVGELIELRHEALALGLARNLLLSRDQVLSFMGYSSRVSALALLHPNLTFNDKTMLLKEVEPNDLEDLLTNDRQPDDIAIAVTDDIQPETLSQLWSLLLTMKQRDTEIGEYDLLYESITERLLDESELYEFGYDAEEYKDFDASDVYVIQHGLGWAIANDSSIAQIARESLWLPAVAAFSANPAAEPDELESRARHDSHQVRACVAMNPRTPTASLAELARDPVPVVRQMAFNNPSATAEIRAQAALIGFD
jgi:hypothetical protein